MPQIKHSWVLVVPIWARASAASVHWECFNWVATSENVPSDMWAQRKFRSACAFDSQGCKISSCGQLRLIRLRGCAGWFESSFGAHVRRYVFSCCGSSGLQKKELEWYLSCTELRDLRLDERGKIGYTFKCLGAGFWALKQSNFRTALTEIVMSVSPLFTGIDTSSIKFALSPFSKGFYSERKELALVWNKFFPFRIDRISKGVWCTEKTTTTSHKSCCPC